MVSVFDKLPKREDGTTITPWDDEWSEVTNVGNVHEKNDGHLMLYESKWSKKIEMHEKVWDFKPAIETGEFVDPGLMRMFQKGAYKKLFDRLYATSSSEPAVSRSSSPATFPSPSTSKDQTS